MQKKRLRTSNQAINPALSDTSTVTRLLPLGAMMLFSAMTPQAFAQQSNSTNEPSKELAAVKVQADADKPDGVRATSTRVGKVLQDPHEIPQAITTLTSSLLEQQHVGSLREALRNVSGLSFNASEGGRSGDNVNLRGFYTFGDFYLDGIRDTAQYNRETFNLEQIDVLRGAGATLFGRGQAGGVINQVSKTPLRFEQYEVTGSLGNRNNDEVTADLNKPLGEHTAIRINAFQRDEGSFRSNPATGDEPEIHRKGVAVSLGLNLHTDNQFWINHYLLKTDDNPDYGVSFDAATRAPGRIQSANTFFGTDATFDKSTTNISTLVNEYKFTPSSQLRTQLRFADYDRSYWAKTPNLTTPPNALAGVGGNVTRASHYKTITLQSDFNTKLEALGYTHEIVTGVEYLNEDSDRRGLQNFGTTAAPDYRPYQETVTGNRTSFTSDSYAVYAQDTVELIPQWKATVGVRRDEIDANYSSATSPLLKFGENSYRAALSFQPDDDTHYYLTWSDTFSPTADLYQLTVTPQPPERSNVVELGAKWNFFDGDLALRTALYSATKNWERNTDLESTAAILTRKRRTNGFEVEVAGRLSERWELFAGLALQNAKILKVAENINATTGAITFGNPGYAGQRARNTPKYTFNVWSTYQLTSRWKVGGGVEAKGNRQGFNPSSAAALPTLNGVYHPNTAPAYARWDALVAYEQSQWALRLNVKNVFNKLYYDSVYDNGPFTVPGARRTATLTLDYKFK
jgi:catecholate siderophore receptor